MYLIIQLNMIVINVHNGRVYSLIVMYSLALVCESSFHGACVNLSVHA